MTHNDILRRLRYAFDLGDSKVIALFSLADLEVSRAQMSDWLKKDDDPAYQAIKDIELATFLNGFIHDKRGKKDGPQPQPEKRLTNNIIFRKLRIALNLKDEDILDILKLVSYTLSKHELSAFFRKPDHRQYRDCKDQIIRNFLHGLQVKYRPDTTTKKAEPTKDMAPKVLKSPQKKPTPSPIVKPKKDTPKDGKPDFKWEEKKAAFKWKED